MKLIRVVLVLGTVAMLCFPRQAAATEFGSPKSYPVGTNPTAVAIGDFNGDGKPDIAVVNSGSNNVSILLGNGDGTFQAAVNSAVSSSGNGPRALAVGDFNGDNKLDLIVVNSGDPSKNIHGALSLLLGKGDGTFQPPVALQAGSFPISVAVADINNDHRLDLLVGDQDAGAISVFLGNGNGTFQAAKTVSLEASGSVNSIVVADFNQDTKPDVVAAIKGGFVVLLGNGDGTFQTPNQVADPVSDIALRIGDFNGDHKVDLLVTNVRRGCLFSDCFDFTSEVLHLGNGDGTFQTGIPVALRSGDSAAADFNGDEKLDLFVTGGSGLLLLGEGNGSFLSVPPPESLPAASAVAAADFSGDGLPDLALTDAANNAVVIVLNTSPASGADLGVTVDPTQANAIVGGNIAYTATILNEGPQDSAVTLTENLPAGWKFVSAQPSQGTCTGATTITCNLGTMPDPSSATVKFAVTPTTAGTSSDSITVSGTQPDLDSKNNSASCR